MRRLLRKLQGRVTRTQPIPAAANTIEATIPPISLDLIDDELKEWARTAEVDLDGPIDGVWWYRGDLDESLRKVRRGAGYVGLQFHGGGYVIGNAKDVLSGGSRIPRGLIEHGICSCVLAVDYSLVNTREDAENHPFPQQILEAMSAYHHLVQTLNMPASRIILVGDSAGGHLTLALQRTLSQGISTPPPGGMVLLSPWCDLSAESHIPHVQRLLGTLPQEQLSNPYFSPALHVPRQRAPPTLLYYGAKERFAASIAALGARLAEAGTQVTTYTAAEIAEHFAHDFLILLSAEMGWPDEVRECWSRIKAWVEALPVGTAQPQ